jgi:hypothetical protein
VAARSKQTAPEELDAQALLATYTKWLNRQPLAQRTRDAYLAQVETAARIRPLHQADIQRTVGLRSGNVSDS